MSVRRPAILVVLLLLCTISGCSGGETAGMKPAQPGVERSAKKGPVELTVRLDRDQLRVGDELRLTIEATAEAGVDVMMPEFEDSLGPFDIIDRATPPDVPEDDRRRWRHVYQVSTFESGELEVPSIEIRFVDRREDAADAEPTESTVATDPIALAVTSVLAETDDPTAMRDVRDPVEVALPANRWLIAGIVGGAILVLAVLFFVLRRLSRDRQAAERAAPVLPPHVRALRELDRLAAEELFERGEIQAYYVRLSDIVRLYIEQRYGLMAPERTTDEFLREARRHPALQEAHRTLLGSFLRTADMVKFAMHRPTAADADEAWSAARQFVEETAPTAESESTAETDEAGARTAESAA